MAIPENIAWAFFSEEHYQELPAVLPPGTPIKDVYYKDINGNWVKVTGIYNCIVEARNFYRGVATKYLGAVLKDTRTEVERGSIFPPKIEKKPGDINTDLKQRLAKYKEAKGIKIEGKPADLYWMDDWDTFNTYYRVRRR